MLPTIFIKVNKEKTPNYIYHKLVMIFINLSYSNLKFTFLTSSYRIVKIKCVYVTLWL